MAYCSECGALLQEGARFCPACGAPAEGGAVRAAEAPVGFPAEAPGKKKRSVFRKWWFWALAAVALAVFGRGAVRGGDAEVRRAEPTAIVTPAPKPTERPAAKPTEAPSETEAPAPAETGIRPEVREFLDAYEACMNEYADFMEKYAKSDPSSMVSMLGDYYAILARYSEFEEKMDAFDETELNDAELAYYIEVTGRVSQRLLRAAG